MAGTQTDEQPSTLETAVARATRRLAVRLTVAGTVIAVLALFFLAGHSNGKAPPGLHRVEKRRIEQTLTEIGRVEAKNVTKVDSPVSGEITWMIEEGTEVNVGDVIVKMSRDDIIEAIEDREERMVPVRNELKKADDDLQIVIEKTRLQIEVAKLAVEDATSSLAELEAKPLPDEKAQAALELKLAELEAEGASTEYASAKTLYDKGLLSELVLKQKKLTFLNTHAKREQARIVYSIKSKGAEKLNLELARAQLEKARLALEETAFNARSNIVIAEKELAVRQVRLSNSERDLKRRREQLTKCDVKAPVPGRVVFVNVWKGSSDLSPIRVGESRRRGWDLLKIADTSALMVKILINEVDLRKVKLGAPARVRLVAEPTEVLAGKVAEIGQAAADKNEMLGPLALARSGEAGVKVVEVTVELADNDPRVRLGYSAEVSIITSEIENALAVPRAAVEHAEDGPYCLLWKGGSTERTKVELGSTTTEMVHITSGLREGDTVVADLAAYGAR